jgi:hypothetical protein
VAHPGLNPNEPGDISLDINNILIRYVAVYCGVLRYVAVYGGAGYIAVWGVLRCVAVYCGMGYIAVFGQTRQTVPG